MKVLEIHLYISETQLNLDIMCVGFVRQCARRVLWFARRRRSVSVNFTYRLFAVDFHVVFSQQIVDVVGISKSEWQNVPFIQSLRCWKSCLVSIVQADGKVVECVFHQTSFPLDIRAMLLGCSDSSQ